MDHFKGNTQKRYHLLNMIKACFSSVTYASKTALPKLVTLDQKLSAVNDSTPI